MTENQPPKDLTNHLTAISGLQPPAITRILQEIFAYFDESVEEFILRRHTSLQEIGYTNVEIYNQISTELANHRFPPPTLTQRQIRRIIYG